MNGDGQKDFSCEHLGGGNIAKTILRLARAAAKPNDSSRISNLIQESSCLVQHKKRIQKVMAENILAVNDGKLRYRSADGKQVAAPSWLIFWAEWWPPVATCWRQRWAEIAQDYRGPNSK